MKRATLGWGRLVACLGVATFGVILGSFVWAPSALATPPDDAFQMGVRAFEQGKTQEALGYFQQAERLRPQDARVANAIGNAKFALNELSEAAREYRRAIHLDPGLAAAHKNLGVLEYRQGRFDTAGKILQAATRLSPADPVAWRFLGLALVGSAHSRQAIPPLERSLKLSPGDSATRLDLASAEARAGDGRAALEDYRLLVRDGSLDAHDQAEVGRALLALNDAANAADQLAFAIQQPSAEAGLALTLAQAEWAANRPEQAVQTIESALPTAHDKTPLYDLEGWIEQQTHNPTRAAEAYRQAILSKPQLAEPYLHLSWLYAEHRHFEESEKTLREGLRFVKEPYALKVQLGTVLVLAGREKEAALVLQQAVASRPHGPLGYTTLIIADTMVDPSYRQPLRAAEAALRDCPDNYLVHYLYAGLLLREHRQDLGQPATRKLADRIKSELLESIRLNPRFPHSHYDLARMDYDAGDYRQAERETLAALAADQSFTSARYLLGRVYLKEGRKQEGMSEIAQVDQAHRQEIQRIEAVGQSLLAAQASGLGSQLPAPGARVVASNESSK